MKWSDLSEDMCPVARTMSVIGDRWTVLILRDCFLGVTRFEAFQRSLGITRHVLADRLARLVEEGVLTKERYSGHSARFDYKLTETGEALRPAMRALADWGRSHRPLRRPSASPAATE